MNFLKSPILWGVIGIGLLIFGFMTSDKDKYSTASIFSGWMIVAGGIITGFSLANIIKWNPLSKLNAG